MKAEKKQMIWPFLAIVAIVAVVGIVMLVMDFKDSSKGGVVGEEGALAGEASLQWLSCIDSDGGNNPNTYGELTLKYIGVDGVQRETISKDSCYSTTQVMERYCSGTTSAFTYQNCLYECSSGVCTDRVKPGDWFILGVPGEIFEYKGADKNTANSPKIKFHKKGEGVTLEYAIPTNGYVKIKVQGMQFNVKIINPAIADSPIQIDYDGDGILDTLPLNDMIYYNQNSLQAMLKQDCATNSKSLVPGETTTLNVGAVTYEVTLNEIVLGSNSIDAIAKFTVNGENLPQLLSGSKVTLVDGINSLKVKEVLLQSYAGGVKSATFCLEI